MGMGFPLVSEGGVRVGDRPRQPCCNTEVLLVSEGHIWWSAYTNWSNTGAYHCVKDLCVPSYELGRRDCSGKPAQFLLGAKGEEGYQGAGRLRFFDIGYLDASWGPK